MDTFEYKIGDKIIHKSIGVCTVSQILEKDYGFGVQKYYVLVPFYVSGNAANNTETMVNVENTKQIRNYTNKKEIMEILKKIPTLESLWMNDSKKRKELFLKILSDGDLLTLCQLVRTVYLKKIEYVELKKNVPITDTTFCSNAEKLIFEEFAISLDKPIEEIKDLVVPKLRYID